MSYTITTSEVLDGFSTSASTADLEGYIAIIDIADACLTANAVSTAIGKQLKILGVRHLAASSTDGGSVTEQTSISGASRKFAERRAGETSHLESLRTIDAFGCVMSVITKGALVQLRSVGRASLG